MKKKAVLIINILLVIVILISINIISSEELKVTGEHPFLVNGSWISASQLKVGDLLTTVDGKKAKITEIKEVLTANPFDVYNLEANPFNDFVVNGNVVVHNSNLPPDIANFPEDNSIFPIVNVPQRSIPGGEMAVRNGNNVVSLPTQEPPAEIKNVLDSGYVPKSRMDGLSDAERIYYAQALCNRFELGQLTDADKIALLEMHYTAEGTSISAIMQKMRMNNGRLNEDKVGVFMDYKITGRSRKVCKPVADKSCNLLFGIELEKRNQQLLEIIGDRNINGESSIYSKEQYESAINEFLIINQKLWDYYAKKYGRNPSMIEILVEEARMGAWEALLTFNPRVITSHGTPIKFSTYADLPIKANVKRVLVNLAGDIPVPESHTLGYQHFVKAMQDYLNNKPNYVHDDMVNYMRALFVDESGNPLWTEKQVKTMLCRYEAQYKRMENVNTRVNEGENPYDYSDVSDYSKKPCDILAMEEQDREIKKYFREILSTNILTPQEKKVVELCLDTEYWNEFGKPDYEKIAIKLGSTHRRVGQLYRQSLLKIRENFKNPLH